MKRGKITKAQFDDLMGDGEGSEDTLQSEWTQIFIKTTLINNIIYI